MPRDETTYRFACEICGDRFESPDREEAHSHAASCEQQGLEVEPLEPGTPVLTSEWAGPGEPLLRIARIAESSIGTGRYQQGRGHQVLYRLDDQERGGLKPANIVPHRPGQLNSTLTPRADTRILGEVLARVGFHAYGKDEPKLIAAAKLISDLSGADLDGTWIGTVYSGADANPHRQFPMLPPRSELPQELLEAIDALARPIGAADLPADAFSRLKGRAVEALRIEGDQQRVRARFPLVYAAAWTFALERAEGRLAGARAFMLCHRDDLPALLQARSDAWWAGEPVSMPAHLLVPAEGTKSGAMSAGQMRALEAVGDVQCEPERTSSYSPEHQWREGAIRIVSAPRTRSNQKIARYRPADAIAGLCGHHPDIRSITIMQGSNGPAVPVICVASGKGGVGKSTVAAALAMSLTRAGTPATLLDLDLEGPSLPALLDLPAAQASGDRIAPHVLADGTRVFSLGQLWPDERALTWETATLEAVVHFLAGALDLGDSQVMVVDLPPGTPPVQMLVNRVWAPIGTLLVTTGSRVAHADLRRAHEVARSPIGIIENLTRAQVEVEGRVVEARLYDGADTSALAAGLGSPYLGSLPHRPEPDQLASVAEMAPVRDAALAVLAG